MIVPSALSSLKDAPGCLIVLLSLQAELEFFMLEARDGETAKEWLLATATVIGCSPGGYGRNRNLHRLLEVRHGMLAPQSVPVQLRSAKAVLCRISSCLPYEMSAIQEN